MKQKNILFICKSNVFRSKVSEAYLKKINKNVNVNSAGVILRGKLRGEQAKATKNKGLIINKKQQGLTSKLLRKQDLIIIVAKDVPKSLFNKSFLKSIKTKAKIIKWGISDIYDIKGKNKFEKTEKTINKLIKKINILNKQLETKK